MTTTSGKKRIFRVVEYDYVWRPSGDWMDELGNDLPDGEVDTELQELARALVSSFMKNLPDLVTILQNHQGAADPTYGVDTLGMELAEREAGRRVVMGAYVAYPA